MKTVSASALQAVAANTGATIRSGGMAVQPAQLAAPVHFDPSSIFRQKPAEAPLPPQRVDIKADDITAAMKTQQQSIAAMGQLVAALVAEIRSQAQASPAPVKAWDFKVTRDDKDRLTGIRATAIR